LQEFDQCILKLFFAFLERTQCTNVETAVCTFVMRHKLELHHALMNNEIG